MDPRLIEPEMLLSEGPEADKIYQELKERAIRRKRQMENESALGGLFEEPEVEIEGDADDFDPEGASRVSLTGEDARKERQKAILDMLKNMSSIDRLDFTNGLVTFVGKRNDRGVIDALMPGL